MTRPLSGLSPESPTLNDPTNVKTSIDPNTDSSESDDIAVSDRSHEQDTFGNADKAAGTSKEVQALACPSPTLENLPAELRIRILSDVPDLRTLRAVIHASPVYFAQYRSNRKSILAQALQAELGDELFVDVYAAFKSRSSKIGPRRGPNSNVTDFLTLYHGWRCHGEERPTPHMFSLDDLRWMTWFYTRTVRPLAAHFVTWALDNSSARPAASILSDTAHGNMSRIENTRIIRAFYRFEIFCHLFGGTQFESSAFLGSYIQQLFFSEFEPWEVEEICCIYSFVKEKYEQIIVEVKWDFDPGNPKFKDDLEFEPEGSFEIDRDYDEFLNGTLGRGGLRLAFHMFRTKDHDDLVSLMGKSLNPIQNSFFQVASSAVAQCDRRQDDPNDKDRAEESGDALTFTGDDSGRPPRAWVLLWGGKYSNLHGEYVPNELRRQGYVMWDEGRLDAKGTREYFVKLWDESPELKMVKEDFPWWQDVPGES